jgi:RNA polymerase sigma-32 factor
MCYVTVTLPEWSIGALIQRNKQNQRHINIIVHTEVSMSKALTLGLHNQLAVLGQDVERYSQTVKAIPILDAEEERELAERWHRDGDVEAARLLVLSNLRFVLHIANGYRGYGLSQADIIQEGNVGLMKAVKRFDPNVGVRLVTFAVHWIRAEIHEFIMRNWRIVKVVTTKAQRKLFFNLRSAKKHLSWLNYNETEKIAADLGVTIKDVQEMEKRMGMFDTAFDGHEDEDSEDSNHWSPSAYLEDNRYNPAETLEAQEWEEYGNHHLEQAFTRLDERSREILQRRWLNEEKATLQELADEYSVSAERIRQIETASLKKLRKQMEVLYA